MLIVSASRLWLWFLCIRQVAEAWWDKNLTFHLSCPFSFGFTGLVRHWNRVRDKFILKTWRLRMRSLMFHEPRSWKIRPMKLLKVCACVRTSTKSCGICLIWIKEELSKFCWLFTGHKFSHAIDLYTQAIELNGNNAVYWANRAFAHTKLEEYGSAILDASKAIEIDPRYSKVSFCKQDLCLFFLLNYIQPYLLIIYTELQGYYRRGAAHLAMGKFKDALKDFQQVIVYSTSMVPFMPLFLSSITSFCHLCLLIR